jgi:hypothetical protein
MKHKTKNILRALAKHVGLKVIFVSYLSDDVHGKLLPREQRILINATKPRCEHVYNLLHELGHFLLHFKKCAPDRYNRWYLKRRWRIDAIAQLASKMRRYVRFIFNSHAGKEWEADLWAMCALVYLKKYLGGSDSAAFLNRHPEKRWIYRLAAASAFYCEIKKPFVTAYELIGKTRLILAAQSS